MRKGTPLRRQLLDGRVQTLQRRRERPGRATTSQPQSGRPVHVRRIDAQDEFGPGPGRASHLVGVETVNRHPQSLVAEGRDGIADIFQVEPGSQPRSIRSAPGWPRARAPASNSSRFRRGAWLISARMEMSNAPYPAVEEALDWKKAGKLRRSVGPLSMDEEVKEARAFKSPEQSPGRMTRSIPAGNADAERSTAWLPGRPP